MTGALCSAERNRLAEGCRVSRNRFATRRCRRANPLDNAPMESFFHRPKTELMHYETCVPAVLEAA